MNLSQAITLIIILIAANAFYNYRAHQKSLENNSLSSQQTKKRASRKPLEPGAKVFGTFVFLIPLLAGIFNINYWFSDYNKAKETLNWKEYDGILISKDIESEVIVNRSTNTSTTNTTYYSADVVYHFTADGDKYESRNIDYNSRPLEGNSENVVEFLKTLPEPGDKITVYANDDKSRSVIIPGTQNMSYFGLLGSLPFFLIGLIGMKFVYQF